MMQVVAVAKLSDFIDEVREEAHRVANRMVRWHVLRNPEQPEQISFQVGAWATALLGTETDPEQYLLECFVPCGRDSVKLPSTEGTDTAGKARQMLAEACDDKGLRLRPGKIEVY
jgi:hypothetical protein